MRTGTKALMECSQRFNELQESLYVCNYQQSYAFLSIKTCRYIDTKN